MHAAVLRSGKVLSLAARPFQKPKTGFALYQGMASACHRTAKTSTALAAGAGHQGLKALMEEGLPSGTADCHTLIQHRVLSTVYHPIAPHIGTTDEKVSSLGREGTTDDRSEICNRPWSTRNCRQGVAARAAAHNSVR